MNKYLLIKKNLMNFNSYMSFINEHKKGRIERESLNV